ncbi:hypothetical protein C8R46DRAFT_1028442 [Mycena filopes]|nr:hypothetical protein C8R46DRAFT_1028442 [Mycena filopes]
MPLLRRTSSTTTHVSDSEPERELHRRNLAQTPSPPDSPSSHRTPLSSISNTVQGTAPPIRRGTLQARLCKLEAEMGELKHDLRVLTGRKRSRATESPQRTPAPKRPRGAADGAEPAHLADGDHAGTRRYCELRGGGNPAVAPSVPAPTPPSHPCLTTSAGNGETVAPKGA